MDCEVEMYIFVETGITPFCCFFPCLLDGAVFCSTWFFLKIFLLKVSTSFLCETFLHAQNEGRAFGLHRLKTWLSSSHNFVF